MCARYFTAARLDGQLRKLPWYLKKRRILGTNPVVGSGGKLCVLWNAKRLCRRSETITHTVEEPEMTHRFLGSTGALALVTIALLTPPLAAQPQAAALTATSGANKWAAPRPVDGQPDLEGVWSNATLTPLERPPELAGKEFLTEKEAAEYEKRVAQNYDADRRPARETEADVARAYNDAWYDRGKTIVGSRRTSLIVDPADGRVPPLTPEGQKREDAAYCATGLHEHCTERNTNSWLGRNLWERCITLGLPILPQPYNNDYQIFQTPGYVAIYSEMIHDVRIIPLDGRPHITKDIRQWLGDSRGHWEGNTLVVDTTNFTDKTNFKGSTANLHLIERFTRTGADTLMYQFTVDDATTFTRPWTVQVPMSRADGAIYEYACHEGNYALRDMLAGGRAQEKEAAESTSTGRSN